MTTVVEFLASKNEVEAKPNTKLDPETYALVKSNFKDKETKPRRKPMLRASKNASITLANAKKRVAKSQRTRSQKLI